MDELAARRREKAGQVTDDRGRELATIREDLAVARGMLIESRAAAGELGEERLDELLVIAMLSLDACFAEAREDR